MQVDNYNLLYNRRNISAKKTNNLVINVSTSGQNDGTGISHQLQKLAELKEKGILTEAEFIAQKAKLLG
jgi:hypothetical protein